MGYSVNSVVKKEMYRKIYLLPGRGGRLTEGLGKALSARGYSVFGRELEGDFERLPFPEKINVIAHDLQEGFWNEDAKVVANSFGAYLLLHAQTLLEPFVGKTLLLSPIVGATFSIEPRVAFTPPRARRLEELVSSGNYPAPKHCEIHVGENDWQSVPKNVLSIGHRLGLKVSIVPNAGHRLPIEYVSALLDSWLDK